jgi:DNA-binding NarL/FixJ family response regulator
VTGVFEAPHFCRVSVTTKTARVLLVDDNPAILAQVVQTLAAHFEIVGTLHDGTTLDTAIAEGNPDLIVLDITLPGENGLVLARRLRTAGCKAHTVFLTVHADPDYARSAFACGASGYVTKARLATDLVPALVSALAGGRFVSPDAGIDLTQL